MGKGKLHCMTSIRQTKHVDQLDKMLSKVGDLNFKRRIIKVLEYLQINSHDVVLDAGCGEGFYPMIFSKLYNCRVCAIDSDEKILEKAKIWIKENGNIDFKLGDLCKLEYPNNYFDKIVCSEVLEHIPDDTVAARELYRVLKSGGTLAVTVPNKNYPFLWDPFNKIRELSGLGHFDPKSEIWGGIWAYDHKRLYSVVEIEKVLLNAGFEVEKKEVITHYGIPFNHLLLVLGKGVYTRLPVSDKVKSSMEKFKWDQGTDCAGYPPFPINIFFDFMKYIDRFNDTEFSFDKPTMAISVKARKSVNI
jgi:SAM-dependent methyltransferase